MTTEDPIIEFREVSFRYRDSNIPALDNLSLKISKGEWVAVLGKNGSGKSTFARMTNALLDPEQGDRFICGRSGKEKNDITFIRQHVGLVFQNPDDQIVASVVEEDCAFGPENLQLDQSEIEKRVERALATTGLLEKRKDLVETLSGGQKQRLALAGVLAMEPQVLVLDEVTAMIDQSSRKRILSCIKELNDGGMTVVSISHSLDELIFADSVVCFDRGRIDWQGASKEFCNEGYRIVGAELPDILKLRRELIENGYLDKDSDLDIESMIDRLCL